MGFVSSLFGGGSQPQQAHVVNAVTSNDTTNAMNTSTDALAQQQSFLNALAGQNGIQNQSNVFNQQQQLAGQLQGVANGTGPNPALAQLHQATGQNVANQAALMAGQRGAGANAGLIARQAGQQGGNLQQQAVGQGATLQAQQQLAGLSALQQQQGMLSNLSTQQVGQQAQGTQAYNQLAQSQQGQLLNSINQQNNANVQNTANYNNAVSNQQKNALGGLGQIGGVLGNIGTIGASLGNIFGGGGGASGGGTPPGGMTASPVPLAMGGEVKSMVGQHLCMHQGGMALKKGGHVPGSAKIGGDSLKNDTVKAMLSPGEIVIPRSVAQHPDAANEAAKFVAAIKAKGRR